MYRELSAQNYTNYIHMIEADASVIIFLSHLKQLVDSIIRNDSEDLILMELNLVKFNSKPATI